jgi:hypothetical protein
MSVAAQGSSRLLSRLRSSFIDPVSAVAAPASAPTPLAKPIGPVEPVEDKLDLFDKILTETEERAQARTAAATPLPTEPEPTPVEPPTSEPPIAQAMAPAVPLAVDQAVVDLNRTYTGTSAKESLTSTPVEKPSAESATGLQMVEVEQAPEMPVEVEGFIQHVEDHQEQLPHEIVVADGSLQLQSPALSLKPVVVLPITPEVEEVGAKKGPSWSIRWLVEWSRKLMKMFNGAIIYREA